MTRLVLLALATLCFTQFISVESRQGVGSGEQEWGFVSVRTGARMFWWLYFTTNAKVSSVYDKPLLIWLQGGPGASSCGYGNFEEIGPYDLTLQPRNYTWVKDYNVLFIDNPVGTGFSVVDHKKFFTRTNAEIARDLLETVKDIYKKLPNFQNVPVYITSESYGGKMAAEFALLWHKAEKSGQIKSKLRGVGLGDSWISPIDSVLTWAPYLLQLGLVDTEGFEKIDEAAHEVGRAVKVGEWRKATELWSNTESVILNVTNNVDFYNVLTKMNPADQGDDYDDSVKFTKTFFERTLDAETQKLSALMNTKVKTALNVNTTWGAQSGDVFAMLAPNFMRPVTHIVEALLNETDLKVFVYTGQLDLIVDTPGTLLWVERLSWRGAKKWQASPRTPLVVHDIIEGYTKSYANLAFYWINRAGHMVPADNPVATAAMLKDLTRD